MCMNRKTAEQLVKVSYILRLWKGSINGRTYEQAIRNFGGEQQQLPTWQTVKKHMLAAHLLQRSNAYTYQEVIATLDHDDQTEHWQAISRNYYTIRRRQLPTTAEGWQAIAA